MANVLANLRCLDLRGETVHTRWGFVTFDRDGIAELEVPEEELSMLQAIKPYSWLAEDQAPPKAEDPPPPPAPPKAEDPPPPPAPPKAEDPPPPPDQSKKSKQQGAQK